jgi:hypothetical protein
MPVHEIGELETWEILPFSMRTEPEEMVVWPSKMRTSVSRKGDIVFGDEKRFGLWNCGRKVFVPFITLQSYLIQLSLQCRGLTSSSLIIYPQDASPEYVRRLVSELRPELVHLPAVAVLG